MYRERGGNPNYHSIGIFRKEGNSVYNNFGICIEREEAIQTTTILGYLERRVTQSTTLQQYWDMYRERGGNPNYYNIRIC